MGLIGIPIFFHWGKGVSVMLRDQQSLSVFITLPEIWTPFQISLASEFFCFFCITLPVSGTIFKLIGSVKYSYFSRQMNVFLDLFIFKGNPSLHENSGHHLPIAGVWRCAWGRGRGPSSLQGLCGWRRAGQGAGWVLCAPASIGFILWSGEEGASIEPWYSRSFLTPLCTKWRFF